MNVSSSLLKEIIEFAISHKANGFNQLLQEDDKYAFALEKCLELGYIYGISSQKNACGVPIFQEFENYSVTDSGLKFLENSLSQTDL